MISFEFIHKIRYSTETRQLGSEGSGQTYPSLSASNRSPIVALQNLHPLPALMALFHNCHPSHYRQSPFSPSPPTFGFTFTNHPGQNSLSRWHKERWYAQPHFFSWCPLHGLWFIVSSSPLSRPSTLTFLSWPNKLYSPLEANTDFLIAKAVTVFTLPDFSVAMGRWEGTLSPCSNFHHCALLDCLVLLYNQPLCFYHWWLFIHLPIKRWWFLGIPFTSHVLLWILKMLCFSLDCQTKTISNSSMSTP